MFEKFYKFKMFIGPRVWRYFVLSFILGIGWFGVESSFVFILQGFLFSIGILSKSQAFLPDWYPTSLKSSVIILILFGIARASIFMLKNYFSSAIQTTFVSEQRKGLFKYGLNNAGNISSKTLISAFTEICSQAGLVVNYFSVLITTVIAAILIFILGLGLAWKEMLIGILLLSIILLPLKFLTRKIHAYGVSLVQEWENVSDYLIKGLKNYFFLSIYKQIAIEVEKGEKSLDHYQDQYSRYTMILGIASGLPLVAGISILSIIAYISVTYFQTNGMKLVSFFYIFIRLAQAASEVNSTLSNIRVTMPGFKVLYDWKLKLINYESRSKLPIVTIENKKIEIEFQNVSFKHGDQKFLFQDLSFCLSSNDVLIVKGESGVGKSSLLSLILDVHKPTSGNILINKISTKDVDLDLQKALAYVGPEPFLIAGTIRENLFYGLSDCKITDEEVWKVLKNIRIADLVESLPEKLNELVNDIPQFSTGQKQRLAFARALLRKPRLLVLDEATANLDVETERIIIENLKNTLLECTTVVVTHKDTFDVVGTHILKLGNGFKFKKVIN